VFIPGLTDLLKDIDLYKRKKNQAEFMEAKISPFRWIVLILLFLNIFLCVIAIYSIPPLFSEIGKEIPLTKAQMGTVMGVVVLASIVFAPLGGALSDKIGSRWALGGSSLIIAAAGAFRTFSYSAIELVICMFFLGAGLNILFPNVPKVLGIWFPSHELARANGICMTSVGVGTSIAMATAVGFMSPTLGGWRGVVVSFSAVSLALGVLWVLFYRDNKKETAVKKKPKNFLINVQHTLNVRDIWIIAIFNLLNGMSWVAILSLLPIVLEERGVAKPGELVSVMMLTSVLFNILSGIASDKAGRRKPFLVIGAIAHGICIPAFLLFDGVPLVIALVVYGAVLGTLVPIMMIIPVELKSIGPALTGTAVGVILMVGNTGSFLGPVVTGKSMDISGSPWPGFIFLSIAVFLSAAVGLILRETGRKKSNGPFIGEY